MDAILGKGLSAKCVTTPRLKCKTEKKRLAGSRKKYVSKIVTKPSSSHIDKELYFRELIISKRIIKEAVKKHSMKWLDSRFAIIYESCNLDLNVNKNRNLKACDLDDNEKYLVLFSINGGCKSGDIELGEDISFFDKNERKHYTGNVLSINGEDYTINVESLNRVITIGKRSIIRSCGVLNKKRILLDFLASLPDIRMRFKYLLESFQFLHSIGIAHLDIKRDNLICDANGICRIIDFGASLTLSGEDSEFFRKLCKKMKVSRHPDFTNKFKEGLLMKIAVHTPGYVSPEFQLCSDMLSLKTLTTERVTKRISKQSKISLNSVDKEFLSSLIENKKDFIIDMFCGSGDKPPALFLSDVYSLGITFKKIVRDGKIQDEKLNDLVSKMTEPIYSKRLTMDDCLKHPFFN